MNRPDRIHRRRVPLLRRSSAERPTRAGHCLFQAVAHRGEKCGPRGFTIVEMAVVCFLMAALAMLLAWAWINLARPAADIAVSVRLLQEMNVATAALAHDLGGDLLPCDATTSAPESQPVGKLIEITFTPGDYDTLELHFDTDGSGSWEPASDTSVKYTVEETTETTDSGEYSVKRLVRTLTYQNVPKTFVVARNLCSFKVVDNTTYYTITLGFKYSAYRWNYSPNKESKPHCIWQRTLQTPVPK